MKKLTLLILITVFGCHQNTDVVSPDILQEDTHHFINLEVASQIAISTSTSVDTRSARGNNKKIKSRITVDDSDDNGQQSDIQPVFYIFNYEEGGYSIISADNRLEPVLAVVDHGPGIERDTELPSGILSWMESTKKQIQKIRKVKLTKKIKKGGRAATTSVSEKQPLLRTRWNQCAGKYASGWPTFNQQIPYTCTNTSPDWLNGHAYVGCTGVAVAQVVRYWGMRNPWFTTPYQYNWSAMPTDAFQTDNFGVATLGYNTNGYPIIDGRYATDETARLMADAAREVHTSYGCSGSGARIPRLTTTFKQYFGYSSATYSSSYRPHDVVANLNMDWPVILGGITNDFWWWQVKGHTWVCDGYRAFQDEGAEYCYYDEYGSYTCSTPVYYRVELHMNWGWGTDHDGWFSSTYFGADVNGRPMDFNYQSRQEMILDIHP